LKQLALDNKLHQVYEGTHLNKPKLLI